MDDEGGGGDLEPVGDLLHAHAGVAGGLDDDEARVGGVGAAEVGVYPHDVGAVEEDVFHHAGDADLHAVVEAFVGEAAGVGAGQGRREGELAGGVETGGRGRRARGEQGEGQGEMMEAEFGGAGVHGMRDDERMERCGARSAPAGGAESGGGTCQVFWGGPGRKSPVRPPAGAPATLWVNTRGIPRGRACP